MSNTTLTASVIAKEALMVLDNELGILDDIYRAHEEEFSGSYNGYKLGDTISIRRPADFTVRTGAVMNTQDVIEGKVTLTVDQQVGVDFAFSSTDLTLQIGELSERVIKPAVINIVNYMANDIFSNFYKRVYNWVGAPVTVINSFADFALAPERLDEMAVPAANRLGMLCPHDNWGLVGSQTQLTSADGLVTSAYKTGKLPMIGGVQLYDSQVTPTHTTGARTNSAGATNGTGQNVTYDSVKNSWTMSLSTNNHVASLTIKEGDVFTLANCNMVNPKTKADTGIAQQFVVCADITTNATTASNTTLTVSPPIILSGPYQTVTLTNGATTSLLTLTWNGTASTAYRQNMVFHKNAFALAVVPMEMPVAAVGGSRQSRKGISLRVLPVYDGTNDVSKWRLDLLYGRKPIDPRLATRLSGT